ncbi:hypothetical protein C1Y12_09985 [Pseudomonas sp. FW305-47B]|nr:hypothetical protein C1Y12_09985 [Pseudomonas sp. FW305-47B]
MPGCPLRRTCARPSDGADQDQKQDQKPGVLPVGASLLAKDVNDNACCQNERGVRTFFASRLAPTGGMRTLEEAGRPVGRLAVLLR